MEDHVSQFMEKCLVWQLSKWVDCDLALAGKALDISVRVIEWNALNTQSFDRSLSIPIRDRNQFNFLPVGLECGFGHKVKFAYQWNQYLTRTIRSLSEILVGHNVKFSDSFRS